MSDVRLAAAERVEGGDELTPAVAAARVARRWWLVALCVAVGAAAGFVISKLQDERFDATATVYVTSGQGGFVSQDRVKSYAAVASSTPVLAAVYQELSLPADAEPLKPRVSVKVPSGTALIDVTVGDPNAERSAEIANAIAKRLKGEVEDIEQTGDGSAVKLTTIQPAEASASPAAPRTAVNVAIGAFAGLVVSVGLALLLPGRPARGG